MHKVARLYYRTPNGRLESIQNSRLIGQNSVVAPFKEEPLETQRAAVEHLMTKL